LKVSYMYYMTGQNFTKILWGTDGNVALSVRVKVLLSFSSPLIRVPVLPSLSGARILNDLHLMTLGFWNKWCLCFLNCTENMLEFVWAFHLCAIKSNKGVIIFFLLLSKNSVLQHQVHEWYLNIDAFTAWFVIALVSIVRYSLNEMTNLHYWNN